jgi:hypothetical protein
MSYSSIFWLPICAVLTALGLGLTYIYGRERGYRAMARGVAWSLIPLAAYLTGSIEMFWKIGTAIGDFATAFVFSPVKWAGIGVAGLAVVLYLASGGRERRKAARAARKAARDGERAKTEQSPSAGSLEAGDRTQTRPASRLPEPVTASAKKPAKAGKTAAPVDDDMKDIEEILRKRGI